MDMYVLLLITLNSWHLCFNCGILRRQSTSYVLLPNFIRSGSIQHRFFVRASALSSMCATIFLTATIAWQTCGGCLRVLRRTAPSICSRRAVERLRAVCVILFVGTSLRAFLPRFPLRPFPRYSIVVRGHAFPCVTSVRLSQNTNFSHWLIS